ncbi:MAG: polyribonucleotide nucleotidyltransferase [Candidatus Cloacimonetes bacterium]|nr:polyribonucleotide nucleotidyltransferase [Candidatus Cloacimonadota bacterium]
MIRDELEYAGRKLSLETGHLANQATAAVLARYGETVVLVTVVVAEPREDIDYFPLFVEYEERLYAGGKIKTSRFVKREGRPRDEAILNARLIDRAIRPLFDQGFKNEVQVIVTILSVDQENDPAILSLVAASAALAISGAPWAGPIAAARIGHHNGNFLLNPGNGELAFSDLDLVVAGTSSDIVMVEAGAKEVSGETILSAFDFAQAHLVPLISFIKSFSKKAAKEKISYEEVKIDEGVKEAIEAHTSKNFPENIFAQTKEERGTAREEFLEELYSVFEGKATKADIAKVFDEVVKKMVREKILQEGVRPDGRKKMDEIRELEIEVGFLPRTHGSAMFRRGETQAITIATLGSTSLEQLIEAMTGEETKRYIHHYNFPPFSTGEVGRMGWPSRREIGHGALAERALLPLIPNEEKFPYTIRLVSEILSSSGSTSMASVCGSTLSLMDAGVPIGRPAAGIAMGLVKKGDDYKILSDIQALEDYFGDMDFKVAGTEKGITALQLDIKTLGLSRKILAEALAQSQEGYLKILTEMLKVIGRPREELSKYAPRIITLQIDPKRIGEIIGPGGKVVRSIQEETNTVIDIKEDGTVFIAGTDEEKAKQAEAKIRGIVREVKVGEIFDGKVTRITDFGAFVEILPGKEGLCHISELTPGYVKNVNDYVDVGDTLKVKVIEIDNLGRINLSHRVLGSSRFPSTRRPYKQTRLQRRTDGYPGQRVSRQRRDYGRPSTRSTRPGTTYRRKTGYGR